jgi:ribokinase
MKIAVVGSLNIDMTVTAPKIPTKGETILGHELHFIPGGKGANQAVALGRLGADVTMFGCVGDDAFGSQLITNLQAQNVKTGPIKVIPGVSTGVALITVGDNDNTIVVVPGANGTVDCAYIDAVKAELLAASLVILQLEIPLATVSYVIDLCAAAGIAIILNPAPAQPLPADLIAKLSYITPNEHEASIVFGFSGDHRDLLRRYPNQLIITQGSAGVSMADADGTIHTVPASPAKVVDTTGAGDTFNGAFAFALANKKPVLEALRFANIAAGLSTEKFGAQGGMPTLAEVNAKL